MRKMMFCLIAAVGLAACGYDRNTKMVPVEPTQSANASDPNAAGH